jgi:branched-chain amino acid transport system substrate-binding protein
VAVLLTRWEQAGKSWMVPRAAIGRFRVTTRTGFVSALLLTVATLTMSDDDAPRIVGEEIPIGVVVALTGHHAEPYGFPMQRGFELAREQINNRGDVRLAFITADDMSNPDAAKAAVRHLVNQNVPAIVGLAISTHLKETAPIAQDNNVIAFSSVSSAAGLAGIGDFVFRTSLATDISIPSGVMATRQKLGYKRVATIYDRADLYSRSSNEVLRTVLAENGVEILTEESFSTGDTDFSRQLSRIAAISPDALFVSALSQEIAAVLAQTAEPQFPDTIQVIAPDLTMVEVQEAGHGAEGAIGFIGWSSMSDAPGNQAFVQNYRAKYGIDPEPWAAQSYATLHVLANAIKTAQSADPTAIRDALAQTMDFPTILGRLGDFSFNSDGDALYDQILIVVKDGDLEFLE